VYGKRELTGAPYYPLASNTTFFLGGDDLGYDSCNCSLQYARVYINYFPNSTDEYINLALMNTGNLNKYLSPLTLFIVLYERGDVYLPF
jgi:hypothetical protein